VSEVEFPETEAEVEPTTAAALKRRIDAGESVTLLDTRPPAEFETWHVDGPTVETINVPYTEFLDGVARPDLEAGADGVVRAAERLHETLEDQLVALPAETLVAPAHAAEHTTPRADGAFLATVGELTTSLELLGVDRETFVDRVSTAMPPRSANHERIVDTNLGRASATGAEAFTMGLGRNNCAASD